MERKVIGAFACLLVLVAVPAFGQDDCATRVTAVQNGGGVLIPDPCNDTSPTAYVSGTGVYGTGAYCTGGGSTKDMWAEFVATSSDVRIRTDIGSVGTDSNFLVYRINNQADVCDEAGWSPWWCSEDEVGYLGDVVVSGLTPGDSVLVQIGTWADLCLGDYTLTVEDPPPLPTLPEWGLLGLGVLLLGGGAVVFGRLRFVA